MCYIICGFATEANMLPPAISIQDMENVVWSIMHCSDLQSGWPYGAQQWGLSGPNSTIQNYHAERQALLTVRGVFNEDLSLLWMNDTQLYAMFSPPKVENVKRAVNSPDVQIQSRTAPGTQMKADDESPCLWVASKTPP
ncbi:hypothetical protein E3N88_04030 [Mikania micrantha]|uniref:Uncharacterized protein n=1 Tax=Mikania micrantha TaxID=192012 RepID=A0A5N6PTS8_9ASTR|nr:hypothetical protein E3N88_04030 [Mikania micrantha]